MKIYTREGDNGITSMFPNGRIPKTCARIDALGTLDELNAWLGVIRTQGLTEDLSSEIETFQRLLFRMGAEISSEDDFVTFARISEEDVRILEEKIDRFSDILPQISDFVAFSGTSEAAFTQLARSVCRRAERCILKARESGVKISSTTLAWINRFSDYLFMLGRILNEGKIHE